MSILEVLTVLAGVVAIVGNIYLAYKLIKGTKEDARENADKSARVV